MQDQVPNVPERLERRMRKGSWRSLGALGVVIVSLVIMANATSIVTLQPQLAAVIASALVELTNVDRSQNGLATLSVSPTLTAVAEAKVADMATKGYFAHTSPEGVTPWHWFADKGYQFSYAGENLAVDFNESIDVERAWMNSPTHRANVVGTQFTEIGIAVATGTYQGREVVFVAQEFGTPARPVETPKVEVVRELKPDPAPQEVAIATVVPERAAPANETEVLGQSAGSYLQTSTEVPWWFKLLRFFF